MSFHFIESITASLVREYLNRKGLKTTLRILDEELPREEDSISNRQQLIKELHMEKLMKHNKEQAKPLKAMLEVIAEFLLASKQINPMVRNDEINSVKANTANDSTRATLNSARTSRSQYPTKEDTQISFDGYPTSQQDEADDLLKPDPNFIYPSHKKKSQNTALVINNKDSKKMGPVKSHQSDLVIEDSHEGETVLGDGKLGVLQLEEEEDQVPSRVIQNRPRSSNRPRTLGMSGPILTTEDSSRRKFHKPRPTSASKNQRNSLFENNSIKLSSLDNVIPSAKISLKPTLVTAKPLNNTDTVTGALKSYNDPQVKDIETLLSMDRKKGIEDVLDIEKESQRPPTSYRRTSSIEKEIKHYSVDSSSIVNKGKEFKHDDTDALSVINKGRKNSNGQGSHLPTSSSMPVLKIGEVEMGDVDGLDQDMAKLDVGPRMLTTKIIKTQHNSKAIDVATAVALKTLIFGTPMQNFNDEWRFQSFSFCDLPMLKYGIVQKKGGPCGVLASVQACVLQELIFGEKKIPLQRFNEPSYEERSEALAIALAKIFWRAGDKRKAIVCQPSNRPVIGSSGKFKKDEFIENLLLYTFVDLEDLVAFMKQAVIQFEVDGLGGAVLSLYSVILSRKIDGVKDDMDLPANKLMGAHGYCTQEMVNLYLSGRAVSNVFNDVHELDTGEGNITILKGIVSRCDVGLLSLFEHYNSCEVGTYLKTPRYPIWVVYSESHFSVLFCTKKELTSDWKAEKRFELYYYDGLARQQEQIHLTIDTNRTFVPSSEGELVPPLELCIRTKWEGAEVNWNGTEPLL